MPLYKFEIKGNQDSIDGNPMGYVRMLSHSIRKGDVKYMRWCEYVRGCFTEKYDTRTALQKLNNEKPLTTSKENPARMDIYVEFANDARADGDNVYKGIADALFVNDKYIMYGSFECKQSKEKKGKVIVKIITQD